MVSKKKVLNEILFYTFEKSVLNEIWKMLMFFFYFNIDKYTRHKTN